MEKFLEKNIRFEKSRYKNGLSSRYTAYLFVVFSLLLAVLGIVLIVTNDTTGYLCFIPLLILYMVHEWYEYDLKNLLLILSRKILMII